MTDSIDYYAVLGVLPTVDQSALAAVYRALAKSITPTYTRVTRRKLRLSPSDCKTSMAFLETQLSEPLITVNVASESALQTTIRTNAHGMLQTRMIPVTR